MANLLNTNPIVCDTFSSAIDIGSSLYGLTGVPFFIESITWETPSDLTHTAVITDGAGNPIFNERCGVVNQSIHRSYNGIHVQGLKIASGAVGSGRIVIMLSSDKIG